MVKPRFAVAGPAVAGCGLSGPHMQALRPATAKRSFTPCKGIKSMRESGVFNGLFSDYPRLFQGWTRGINLKTRGDCLLQSALIRTLWSLRDSCTCNISHRSAYLPFQILMIFLRIITIFNEDTARHSRQPAVQHGSSVPVSSCGKSVPIISV